MSQWAKGQSGNPSGGRKTRIMTDALTLVLTEDPRRARAIAQRIAVQAAQGDMMAAKLIFDRLEGKAIETIRGEVEHVIVSKEERLARLAELQAKAGIIDGDGVEEIEVTNLPAPTPAKKKR